jgi:hypothetical protein
MKYHLKNTFSNLFQKLPAPVHQVKNRLPFLAQSNSNDTPPDLLPEVVRPVIVIPGVLGTWPPALAPKGKLDPLSGVYDNLLKGFQAIGYKNGVTLFRLHLDELGDQLGKEIERIRNLPPAPGVDYSRVDLVCHSMGGLLARSYIQSNGYETDVARLMLIAVPNHGAAVAYPAYAGGQSDAIGVPMQAAQAMAQMAAAHEAKSPVVRARLTYETVRRLNLPDMHTYMQKSFHSIQDMLPLRSTNYLYMLDEWQQQEFYPYGCPENDFLDKLSAPSSLKRLSRVAEIINLYSASHSTPVAYTVRTSNHSTLYKYGEPIAEQPAANFAPGDAIVPEASAKLSLEEVHTGLTNIDMARMMGTDLNHVQIVGDPAPVRHLLGYFVRPEIRPLGVMHWDGPLLSTRQPNLAALFI